MSFWETASNVAGVLGLIFGGGGFYLGVQNYRQSRKALKHTLTAPEREERRRLRNEVRELLIAVKIDLDSGLETLAALGDLPAAKPDSFQVLEDAIPRYMNLLKIPSPSDLHLVGTLVGTCGVLWDSVVQHIRRMSSDAERQVDPQGRERQRTERNASDVFAQGLKVIDETLAIIAKVNERELNGKY